jgi:hypothetical protein
MNRQYNAQRFRPQVIGGRVCRVGTVQIGQIVDLPARICANRHERRVIVEAWIPREYAAAYRTADGGVWRSTWMVGGHLAMVRTLSNGRPRIISDAWLRDTD